MSKDTIKVIANNRKARHDFFIEQTFETGIALYGTEVKSIRNGLVNLKDSYAHVKDGEVFIEGMHISPYEQGNINNHDPIRIRKLLLHKSEIIRLIGYVKQKGRTLVPSQLYFKGNKVKVLLAVARGKKLYDKRHDIAERDSKREIDRRMKTGI